MPQYKVVIYFEVTAYRKAFIFFNYMLNAISKSNWQVYKSQLLEDDKVIDEVVKDYA